jgi:hypothetical protein
MANRRKRADSPAVVNSKGDIAPPLSLAEAESKIGIDDEGTADLEDVKAAGALNPESVAFNEHTQAVIAGKQDRTKRVRVNDPSAMIQYDVMRQVGWNLANIRIDCMVAGQEAAGPQWKIQAIGIKDGSALYDWVLREAHKKSPERTYLIRFMEHTGQERGRGKITMPDTTESEPAPAPAQPPPPQYPYPYQQPAPPPGGAGYPYPYPGSLYQSAPPPSASPPAPAPPPSNDEAAALRAQIASLQADLGMARAREGFLSGQLVERGQAPAPMPPPAPAPPPIVVTAPAPPAPTPPPDPVRKPGPDGAPPGFTHVPGFGFISSELMAQVLMKHLRETVAPPPAPPPTPPAPAAPVHTAPPPPPTGLGLTPITPTLTSTISKVTREMEEATGGLVAMYRAAEKIREAFPSREREREEPEPTPAPATQANGDPAKKPFEILEAGPVRIPFDPETGSVSGIMHLGLVNADKLGDWAGKLFEKVSTAAATAQAAANGRQYTPPPTLPQTAVPGWPPPPPMPKG